MKRKIWHPCLRQNLFYAVIKAMDRQKVWILVDRPSASLISLLFMVSHFVRGRPDLNVQSQCPNTRPSGNPSRIPQPISGRTLYLTPPLEVCLRLYPHLLGVHLIETPSHVPVMSVRWFF
jgi:hypothetical protein